MAEPDPRRLLTVEEFLEMADSGLFSEDVRVELIEGEIVEMAPIAKHHAGCVRRILQALAGHLGTQAVVDIQNHAWINERSFFCPDALLLRKDFLEDEWPTPQDVYLAIEVADTTSLSRDRDLNEIQTAEIRQYLRNILSGRDERLQISELLVPVVSYISSDSFIEFSDGSAAWTSSTTMLREDSCDLANARQARRPRPPGVKDVLLLVEVSDSSLAYDRDVKIPLYAESGVPETWLIDLNSNTLFAYRRPSPQGYLEVREYRRGDEISPEAFPDVRFSVDSITA